MHTYLYANTHITRTHGHKQSTHTRAHIDAATRFTDHNKCRRFAFKTYKICL